jgi:hypothetical protein
MCNKKVTGEDQGCDHVEPGFMHTCHKCEMMGCRIQVYIHNSRIAGRGEHVVTQAKR